MSAGGLGHGHRRVVNVRLAGFRLQAARCEVDQIGCLMILLVAMIDGRREAREEQQNISTEKRHGFLFPVGPNSSTIPISSNSNLEACRGALHD